MREPAVVLAHSVRGWAQDLHFFLMDHGGAIVRGYVMSPDDALAEAYDVFLVDDITSYLNHRLVTSLHAKGVKIVGVFDPDDGQGAGKQRLLDLGVDEAMPSTSKPAEFVQAVGRLAGPFIEDDLELAGMLDTMSAGRSPVRSGDQPPAGDDGASRGRFIAVAAASGGSGATEIALALAERLRDTGSATVLVDADDQAPALAQRLNLPLHPNVRTAVDAVQHGTGSLTDALVTYAPAGIEVLCGIPNPRDWFELRPSEVMDVLTELAVTHRHVVANVGPHVDDLPSLGGPPRFGLARAAIGVADATVLVGAASPVGARRIIDWLADAKDLVQRTPLHLVVNQYPGGRFAIGELETELRRTFQPDSFTVVPYDRRVLQAAWEGEPVGRSPFLKALSALRDAVLAGDRA